MELEPPLLGFNETASDVVDVDRSFGHKLVPWLNWEEWDSVREALFSSSSQSVGSALRRIAAWRSRGCLPVVVEVSASIVEIQQKDPSFRVDLGDGASESEEMLAMQYCMAIMRLVNGVVEKTRKKTEVSIAEAADAINIPRMLIDIRHEGSHRDLPSLRLVRLASVKALDWLKSYYWEPQKKAIPFRGDATAILRNEIKSRMFFCLEIKQATESSSSLGKEKRIKHCELLWGRHKFLSLRSGKPLASKSAGYKIQITKAFKNLGRLYSSCSSEVVSVLVELLLKGSDSSDFVELPHNYQVIDSTNHVQSVFDYWKPVIAKLSKKEPDLPLALIKTILQMIETHCAMKTGSGEYKPTENTAEVHHMKRLVDLYECLVRNLKDLNLLGWKDSAAAAERSSADKSFRKATLMEILRRSLLVSSLANHQLNGLALVLAQMIGSSSLVDKLSKLYLLGVSNPTIDEENSSTTSTHSILAQQEESLHQASEKLEFVKLRRIKRYTLKTLDGAAANNSRWVVAKSWNSCPIGMLPCDVGSSGRLPFLDCGDDHRKVVKPLETEEEQGALNQCTNKRRPDCDVELLDNSRFKKTREAEVTCESDGKDDDVVSEGVKGQLMIGGVWKKVGKEELLAIASAVRILI